MDKFFNIRQSGSTVRTEIMAGLTTFFAMAYIVFVNPNQVAAEGANGWLAGEFGMDSVEKNARLPRYLKEMAEKRGVHFFNIGEYVTADPTDGIHMNEAGHKVMAEKMFEQVKNIIG